MSLKHLSRILKQSLLTVSAFKRQKVSDFFREHLRESPRISKNLRESPVRKTTSLRKSLPITPEESSRESHLRKKKMGNPMSSLGSLKISSGFLEIPRTQTILSRKPNPIQCCAVKRYVNKHIYIYSFIYLFNYLLKYM